MYSEFVDIYASCVFLVMKCFNKLVCVLTYLHALFSFLFFGLSILLAKIESLNQNSSLELNPEGRVFVQ